MALKNGKPNALNFFGLRRVEFAAPHFKYTAIDKYNPTADVVVDLLDYNAPENHFDVVIALGATNLESFELISQQIERLVYWCKPGGKIYMRVNPVLEEVVSPKQGVCKWTIDHIAEYTRKHNLEIIKPVRLTNGLRYIFTWQKQK